MGLPNNKNYEDYLTIPGLLEDKQEVMRLYETEKASTMSSLLDKNQESYLYNPVFHFLALGVASVTTVCLCCPSVRRGIETFAYSLLNTYKNNQ